MNSLKDARLASSPAEPASVPSEIQREPTLFTTAARTRLLTVSELADLYYTFRCPELAPKSVELSRRYLGAFVNDFGHLLPSQLHRREFIAWLRNAECWPAPATKKSALNRIKAMFGWAMREDDLLDKHPFPYLSWEDSDPRRSMRDDEYASAWAVAPSIMRRLMYFLRGTGARPGEAAKLKTAMIHWDKSIAVLAEHKTKKKTGQDRVIYLSADIVRFLKMLAVAPKHKKQGDLVFCNSRGTRWTSCQMSTYWTEIRETAGLAEDCVLYGLRHRFGTLCSMKYPIAVTAKLMGHRSIKTTAKYYCHIEEHRDYLLEAAGSVNERS